MSNRNMTSFQTFLVDFDTPKFDSVVSATTTVESSIKEADRMRTILVLRNTKAISTDTLFLPVLDRWIRDYPGRIFLDTEGVVTDHPISLRFPIKSPSLNIVFSGQIIMSEQTRVSVRIFGPCRPNRLPQNEFLFPVGRLSAADAAHVPMTLNAKLKCEIEDESLFDFTHLVLVSGSEIFWLQDSRTLVQVQNLETLKELCREAKSKSVEKPTYIRSLAVNADKMHKSMARTSFNAVVSKKQLGILKTQELIESRIVSFFAYYTPQQRSNVTATAEQAVNYESAYVMRKIAKVDEPITQAKISEIFKSIAAEGDAYEELVYQGKRRRRLFGTSFSSHKWPVESTLTRDAIVDGPLLSEVVGELMI